MKLIVKNPRGFETRRGIHWSGVLYADGKPVMRFENPGDGGCTAFDWRPGCDREAIERALVATTTDTVEPLDTAIGALWDHAMLANA